MNVSIQRQLSVAIENQPGRLAAVSTLMADQGINIRDLSVVDNVEQGMIRLITSDPAACKTLLTQHGFYVVEAEVLVLILTDLPGRLAQLCQKLADARINIDYAYGSEDADQEKMRVIMKVANIAQACEVIRQLQET